MTHANITVNFNNTSSTVESTNSERKVSCGRFTSTDAAPYIYFYCPENSIGNYINLKRKDGINIFYVCEVTVLGNDMDQENGKTYYSSFKISQFIIFFLFSIQKYNQNT